jgi:hypothetical protein
MATTQSQPISIHTDDLDLKKSDSAMSEGLSSSPIEAKIRHRRTSSTVSGVFNINDLGEFVVDVVVSCLCDERLTNRTEKEGAEISISIETQKTNW